MDANKVAGALIAKQHKAEQEREELLALLPIVEGMSWDSNRNQGDDIVLLRYGREVLGRLRRHSDCWVIFTHRLTGRDDLVEGRYKTGLEAGEVLLALTRQLDADAAG
ncbi:MAG: hypothetical protein ISN29_08570 [Gammaproteobacteria bacterium AqS3]|nr:hypothetical protein [Gammaproteobacteria bacterium AqS3]